MATAAFFVSNMLADSSTSAYSVLSSGAAMQSLAQFLVVPNDDDEAFVTAAVQASCGDIAGCAHVCNASHATALNRFVHGFVYESEDMDRVRLYANSACLSQCSACLACYCKSRDSYLRLCKTIYDEDSVGDLKALFQRFDSARLFNNVKAWIRSQTMDGCGFELDMLDCIVTDVWLHSEQWWKKEMGLCPPASSGIVDYVISSLGQQVFRQRSLNVLKSQPATLLPCIVFQLFSLASSMIREAALALLVDAVSVSLNDQVENLKQNLVMAFSQALNDVEEYRRAQESEQLNLAQHLASSDSSSGSEAKAASDTSSDLEAVAASATSLRAGAASVTVDAESLSLCVSGFQKLLIELKLFGPWSSWLKKFVSCLLRIIARCLKSVPNMDSTLVLNTVLFMSGLVRDSHYCSPTMTGEEDLLANTECSMSAMIDMLVEISSFISHKSILQDPSVPTMQLQLFSATHCFCSAYIGTGLLSEFPKPPLLDSLIALLNPMTSPPPIQSIQLLDSFYDGFRLQSLVPPDFTSTAGTEASSSPTQALKVYLQTSFMSLIHLECVLRGVRSSQPLSLNDPLQGHAYLNTCLSGFTDIFERRVLPSVARRDAALESLKEIVWYSFNALDDEVLRWQYLCSCFLSLKCHVAITKDKIKLDSAEPANDEAAVKPSILITQIAVPKEQRCGLYLPVGSDGDAASPEFVTAMDSSTFLPFVYPATSDLDRQREPFRCIHIIKKAFPILLLKTYSRNDSCERFLDNLMIRVGEWALLPQSYERLHKKCLEALRLPWDADLAPLDTALLDKQMEHLVGFGKQVTELFDLIHGTVMFVFRLQTERLQLWSLAKMNGDVLGQQKLPVTELSMHPELCARLVAQQPTVSLQALQAFPKLPLTDAQRLEISKFPQSNLFVNLEEFSISLAQMILLSFALAAAEWPLTLKQEVLGFFSLLCASMNGGTTFLLSCRCENLEESLIYPHSGEDESMLRCLGQLFVSAIRIQQSPAQMLQAVEIALDYKTTILSTTFQSCCVVSRLPPNSLIETLFIPLVVYKQSFWFLRGLFSSVDLCVEQFILTGMLPDTNISSQCSMDDDYQLASHLANFEGLIWTCIRQVLKFGPLTIFHSHHSNAFDFRDGLLCFFGCLDKFLGHVARHVQLASSTCPQLKDLVENVHLPQFDKIGIWAEQIVRWGRFAQSLAVAQLEPGKNQEAWSSETNLGQAVRDACVSLCGLSKIIKTVQPTWFKALPRDIQTLAQGKMSLTAPLSTNIQHNKAAKTSTSSSLQRLAAAALSDTAGDTVSVEDGASVATDVLAQRRKKPGSKPAAAVAVDSASNSSSLVGGKILKPPALDGKSRLGGVGASSHMRKSNPRESLMSKLMPGGSHKKTPRTYDVALEMMSSWNQQGEWGSARKPVSVRPADSTANRPALVPKAAIMLDPLREKQASAPVERSRFPELKKMTQEEKTLAMQKASLGVQIMLQNILDWDFTNLDKYELPELQKLPEKLPLTFETADAFREYFRPLVLEECRCGILQEKMERKLESSVVVISKATVSANWMLATAKCGKWKRGDGTGPSAYDPSKGLSPERAILNAQSQDLELLPLRKHDLVMLVPIPSVLNYQNPYEGKSLNDLTQLPSEGYFLAVVEKTDPGEDRFEQADLTQCRLRFPRALPPGISHERRLPASAVSLASAWLVFPLASLTTFVREFQSLFTACFSPVFDFMMKPHKYGIRRPPFQKGKPQAQVLEKLADQAKLRLGEKKIPETLPLTQLAKQCTLNESQTAAVKHAVTADFGVSLLQGPPGTGKTKTLLAIIAGIFAMRGAFTKPSSGAGSSTPGGGSLLQKKLLVCAPSNAAVDEIAARILKDGIVRLAKDASGHWTQNGEPFYPSCLRVGKPNRITRDEVKEISLEETLANENQNLKGRKIEQMKNDLQRISNRLDAIEEELSAHNLAVEAAALNSDTNVTLGMGGTCATRANAPAFVELTNERRALLQQRKKMKEGFGVDLKQSKNRSRDQYLKNTDIFFATLSGSASEVITGVEFDFVIVDEAAQAVELSSLIPLRHEVTKLVLIGDPQQLPATVLSASAKKFNYERSLFQRLQLCGVDVIMLGTQYRMRPEISAFPAGHFYHGRLANDQSVCLRPPLPFQVDWKCLFGPFKFFDVPSTESRHHISQSLCNRDEAGFIVQLLILLVKHCISRPGGGSFSGLREELLAHNGGPPPTQAHTLRLDDVAIITPYKQQVLEIQRLLKAQKHVFEPVSSNPVEVCTIDSFQGREKKIIIFSCVRSLLSSGADAMGDSDNDFLAGLDSDSDEDTFFGVEKSRHAKPAAALKKGSTTAHIGFVADVRRLNVAITRARDALWIIGNSKTLKTHETWGALIAHAKTQSKTSGGSGSVPNSPFTDEFSGTMDQAVFVEVEKSLQELRGLGVLNTVQTGSSALPPISSPLLTQFLTLVEKRQHKLSLAAVQQLNVQPHLAASKPPLKRPAPAAPLLASMLTAEHAPAPAHTNGVAKNAETSGGRVEWMQDGRWPGAISSYLNKKETLDDVLQMRPPLEPPKVAIRMVDPLNSAAQGSAPGAIRVVDQLRPPLGRSKRPVPETPPTSTIAAAEAPSSAFGGGGTVKKRRVAATSLTPAASKSASLKTYPEPEWGVPTAVPSGMQRPWHQPTYTQHQPIQHHSVYPPHQSMYTQHQTMPAYSQQLPVSPFTPHNAAFTHHVAQHPPPFQPMPSCWTNHTGV